VLEWCGSQGHAVVPYGGGSSVVGGVDPPEGFGGIVTIDMEHFDRVLELDGTSRAARIQAQLGRAAARCLAFVLSRRLLSGKRCAPRRHGDDEPKGTVE